MEVDKNNDKKNNTIFKRKIRCEFCHEIPIIKDIIMNNGVNCFISSECLNRHGRFCPVQDYCDDKFQLDQIKCNECKLVQNVVNSRSKLFIFCKECNKYFCPKCYKSHYKKFAKTHHELYLHELDYKCKEHTGEFSCFCVSCNKNLCPLCYQREHFDHNVSQYDKIKPNEKLYTDIKLKLEEQKAQISIINQHLDNLVKLINNKIKEYKHNLKMALLFNYQIFNCYNIKRLNYQSIANFSKVIDIDITDIAFIQDIQKECEKFVEMIKSKSSYKIFSPENKSQTQNINQELLQTVKTTLCNSTLSIDEIIDNTKKEDVDGFNDNELLEKIGKKNKRILNKEDLIGKVKKIYSIDSCKIYSLIIDNGVFLYDQKTNDLVNFIDINEGFGEYNEIKLVTYYYNKQENMIYFFIGTQSNRIKIYNISIKDDFEYKLIYELKLDNIINISCNINGQLIILDKNGISIYKNVDNKYEIEKEIKNEENKNLNNLFETKNYLIFTIEGKEEILILEKKDLEKLFYLSDIPTDNNSQFFEIVKDLIGFTFKNKIKVIYIKDKKIYHCYQKENIKYIQCAEVINSDIIFISKKEDNKLILSILKWDDLNKNLKEKDTIEDLDCKMVCKINKNNVIMHTKYGINVIELKDNI